MRAEPTTGSYKLYVSVEMGCLQHGERYARVPEAWRRAQTHFVTFCWPPVTKPCWRDSADNDRDSWAYLPSPDPPLGTFELTRTPPRVVNLDVVFVKLLSSPLRASRPLRHPPPSPAYRSRNRRKSLFLCTSIREQIAIFHGDW